MNKIDKLFFGFLVIISFILGFCISQSIGTEKELIDKQINFPSQCYTNLQPSRFFMGSPSPIYTSEFGKKVIIESLEIMFVEQVSNTGSMRPTLSDYSATIQIKPTKQNIKVGDIIAIDIGKKNNIIHRVIKIENGIYTTKGDNNKIEDKYIIKFENITGRVVGVLY